VLFAVESRDVFGCIHGHRVDSLLARGVAVGSAFFKGAVGSVDDELARGVGASLVHPGLDGYFFDREDLTVVMALAIELPAVGVGDDVIAYSAQRGMPASVLTLLEEEGQERGVRRHVEIVVDQVVLKLREDSAQRKAGLCCAL